MCQQGNYRSRARHTFRCWGMHKAVELRAEKVAEAEKVEAEKVAGAGQSKSSLLSHNILYSSLPGTKYSIQPL